MKHFFYCLILITVFTSTLCAQTEVTKIEINGTTYTVCQKFPKEICGEYTYQKKAAPKVLLNNDGTGYFQRMGVKPHVIKFWISCNENGDIKKTYSLDGNYEVTLVYQYVDADVRALWGEYETMDVNIAYDKGYAIIFEERFHKFR